MDRIQPENTYYTKEVEARVVLEYWVWARDKEQAEELFNEWDYTDETLVEVQEVITECEIKGE